MDTVPSRESVTQLSQVIHAECEGAVGNEGQQYKRPRVAGMQVEGGEDPKSKGKGQQKTLKGKRVKRPRRGMRLKVIAGLRPKVNLSRKQATVLQIT